jgi:hypothetical protein
VAGGIDRLVTRCPIAQGVGFDIIIIIIILDISGSSAPGVVYKQICEVEYTW